MKNLKNTILTALLAIGCFMNANAQSVNKTVDSKAPGFRGVTISLGGGISSPSSDGKENAFLTKSTTLSLDASIPITRRGWGPNGNWFGINVGGAYNFGGSGGFGTTLNPYAITGQTSSMVSDKGGAPADAGFRMGAGPQVNFNFGKHFTVSPMVLAEYFSMTQKTLSAVQTTQYNGQSYDFNLVTMPETKTSGFAVTPKLRLQYKISDIIDFFAEGSYTSGPKVETQLTKLIPNGNPSPQSGSYSLQQLQTASYVKGEVKSTSYSAMNFGAGLTFTLGGNSHGDNLTNGINKPACTCCGSKYHATGECPDYPNCHNVNTTANTQVPNSDFYKADEDIKKGWNGIPKASVPIPGDGHIVLTPECCIDPVTGRKNGLVRFKMTGTLVYATIKVTSGSGIYLTETTMPFVNNTYSDCFRKPVKFEYIPSASSAGMTTTSSINGVVTNSYTYNSKFSCINWDKIYIDKDWIKVTLPDLIPSDPIVVSTFDPSIFHNNRLISNFTNPKTKEVITVSSDVEISENGDMTLIKVENATSTINGKTTPIDVSNSKKHNYVGHVTLLK